MADNYTPEEIQEIFTAYNNAIKSGTPISAELAKQMQDAAKGAKGTADALNKFGKSLGTSAADLTKALYKGEQGAGTFGNAVETAGTALQALILAIPGIGIAAKVAAVAIGALAKGANAAAKQGDQLYKTYQDLNKIGASTAGGMTDVFNNMQKFGYGLEELDKMTDLIRQNSEALSNFGGTVGSGAAAFANAADQIQHSEIGKSLQMLGKTPDDINKGVAGFVKQQTLLGRGQADVNKELVSGSAAYVKNLDLLSRLTGQSADQLEAKQEQALAEDAYNQTQYELKKKADAGDLAAAQKYQANIDIASRLTGTALKEFQQGVGGDLSAMSKTMMTASGAVSVLGKTTYTADEYLQALKDGADKSRASLGGLAKFNATNDFLLPMKEIGQIQSKYADETAEQISDRAKLEQQVRDPATKAATELRISRQVARDSLQSFVQLGVNPATQALNKLAGGAAGASKILPGSSSTSGAMGGGSNKFLGGSYRSQLGTGSLPPGATDVDKIMATIRKRESGGNYGAQAKGSSASGAYQFIDSTWQSLTKKSGIGTEYSSAKLAPKEIQDAIAKNYVQDILKQAGGDVSKVPLAWYTGNIQGKISPSALAANNGLTPEMYQSKWMKDYAGVNSTFQSSLSGINPSQDMKNSQQTQPTPVAANATENQEKMTGLLVSMNDQLAQLNKVNRNQLDVQQKTLQRQS